MNRWVEDRIPFLLIYLFGVWIGQQRADAGAGYLVRAGIFLVGFFLAADAVRAAWRRMRRRKDRPVVP